MQDPHSNSDPLNAESTPMVKRVLMVAVILVFLGGVTSYFLADSNNTLEDQYGFTDGSGEGLVTNTFDINDNTVVASSREGFDTFKQNAAGFQIDFPQDWTYEVYSSVIPVMFRSPEEPATQGFVENVVISLEDVSAYEGLTLDQYADAAYGQLLSAFPDYRLLQREQRQLGEYDGMFLVGSYPADENSIVQVMSLFSIVDNMVYVFTYTHGDVEEDPFAETVDAMISSFTVIR